MKLECLIRRKGGTTVTFNAKSRERLGLPPGQYHFKPETAAPDAPHVAEVANTAHVDHFLSTRGFRVFNGESLAAPALTKEPIKPDADAFDAAAIQGKSVRDLREVVDTLTTEQVREVLQLEQEDPNPRSSVVDLLLARIRKDEGQ